MASEQTNQRAVDIIVPFFRRPDLVAPLFASILRVRAELVDLSCAIVAVNDSPDDGVLKEELARAANQLDGVLGFTILENQTNQGFVRSANRALQEAIRLGHDVLLLNSDALLFAGTVAEMRRVAYLDPAIGFVSPRSNNAAYCALPHQTQYQSRSPEESFASFSALKGYLPDHHYVPTGVGFCLYIKLPVLEEVGIFDDVYSPGYQEENDLVMRADARGYRAVLANHAYAYHVGTASFDSSGTSKHELDKRNLGTLLGRYPHFMSRVDEYYQSEHFQAEVLLAGLLRDQADRWDAVLDLSALALRNDDVSGKIREFVTAAVELWSPCFNIFAMGSREILEYHQLDKIPGLSAIEPDGSRVFAIALRLGLPTEYEDIVRLNRIAACNVYVAFDPSGPDSPPPGAAVPFLLAEHVFQSADGVIYEGDFMRDWIQEHYRTHPSVGGCVASLSWTRSSGPNQSVRTTNGDEARRSAMEAVAAFLKRRVESASFETMKRRSFSMRLLSSGVSATELRDLRQQLEVIEADRAARLDVIQRQVQILGEVEAERDRLAAELRDLRQHLEVIEADRAARLDVIQRQMQILGEAEAERDRAAAELRDLRGHFEASEADRAVRLAAIEEQGRQLGEAEAERNRLATELSDLRQYFEASEADRAGLLAVIQEQGRRFSEIEAERSASAAELHGAVQGLEDSEARYAEQQAVCSRQEQRIANLQSEVMASRQEAAHAAAQLPESEESNRRLREQVRDATVELDGLRSLADRIVQTRVCRALQKIGFWRWVANRGPKPEA